MTRQQTASLADFGVIAASGADAVTFLQGQLSQDVTKLTPSQPLTAGYHNPQGRVIALLRLCSAPEPDGGVLAALPRELVAPVIERLRKYVLRAKVKLEDRSDEWTMHGLVDRTDAGAEAVATWTLDGTRALALYRAAEAPAASLEREAWRRLDVAGAVPQVYAVNSEAFVSQMLNLDELGAIAFDKGCYTGQEIIARAHYRGRIKRRMQRLRTRTAATLAAGDEGKLDDGRSFRVVDAVALEDGRAEFLAVAQEVPAAEGVPDFGYSDIQECDVGELKRHQD